ncbi:unnamed protein product [Rotaria magnacalcarata]|uniref:Uncharacterized protein n=1 Tax=Rotaria magnacalcarata TaxID=392030 RepID=A0A816Q9H6_9BILA|nr:unnamed protein product [Rotaria magnacalcarata]
MHIHRHHRSLLNPSFQQQENNGIVQLPIQQPDTTHIYPTTIDYTDENVIYSDIDDDILGNQSNMSSAQVSYDDNKVDIIAVQQLYSRFLLEMREQHILPQLVIQSITTYIVNLLDIIVELIEEQAKRGNMIQQQSASTSISVDDMRSTVNQIEKSIILSTRNEYQFLQSCQKFFNYSPPTQNILSSNQSAKEFSYHVSIKQTIRTILEKDYVLPLLTENVRNQVAITQADPDLMFSFRDGIRGRKTNKQSFMIQLYVDGIGVTNPLGPKKDQHKLTMVYFTLEDMPDTFRSTLQCINLAAICYTKYLDTDEKIRKFYEPIVNDLNDLQCNGLMINKFDTQSIFSFSTIAADNLAAHELAGFQQTFRSGYFCRRCLVTYENRLLPLTDVHFIQRTHLQYNKYLNSLENDLQMKSKFGVVGPSPLNGLQNFDPTSSFPGDLMHDFYEGVCPLIIMAMLKEASSSRLITYNAIQNRTENFVYGNLDKSNKPPAIMVKHLNSDRIVGSAAQKYCLFHLFPIMFSDLVEHLESFKIYLILRELLDMVLALPQRKSWLPFMETLSINFQCLMLDLLPHKVIPKVHFITEYARIIEENGPPVRYWCMRYEAAHLYFKKIAMQSYNFKNVPKTLAQRQQLRQCFFYQNLIF